MNELAPSAFDVFERAVFAESGSRPFRRIIPENECLIRQLRNKIVRYTGISMVEIHDVHLWTDLRTMCLYDSYCGVYESLSLEHHDMDWDRAVAVPVVEVPGTTVLLPHLDSYNYYHWLIDTVPGFGVLDMAGVDVHAVDHIYIHLFVHEFQRQMLKLMNVDIQKVMSYQRGENHYVFEKLLIPDFRLNGFGWPNPWLATYLRERLTSIAESSNMAEPDSSAGKLYVARGASRRAVSNEAELIERLKALGYFILDPNQASFSEQVQALKNADFVLAAHGAGLANIVFCKPDTKVIEFGGHYITEHFRVLGEYCQVDYRAIAAGVDDVGNRLPISDAEDIRELEFIADIDHIVDRAEAFYGEH
jgi:capsular polysaccharide biosynthesis protein